MDQPIKIVVIAGPTAVGKTAFAIGTARRFGGEIVSCDSMQLYKYMDIGSAKPTEEERALAAHHLIDCIDPLAPKGDFSAAKYAVLAEKAIRDIHARDRLPIVSGGTGLYLNAILYEMDFGERQPDLQLRSRLSRIAETEGPQPLHEMLREKDPKAAERIHPNNVKKVIRALERLEGGEETLREFHAVRKKNPLYDPVLIGLTRDRSELYERINARVQKMIEEGLVEEVRRLQKMGLSTEYISMLGIGYKEILAFLAGETTLAEATELIQKNTRHFAKRQLTWFRRYDKMFWLDISEYGDDHSAMEELFSWLGQRL
ncbi:MAG: tRNA (adenosine(37)-N6)-dimethylallyltransferase MiaA [Firmicutes bacterium]|nr:tRNA (adenosine(37)-N6)-dimethylallyltransferase MiaA [Bacillota bacterium]